MHLHQRDSILLPLSLVAFLFAGCSGSDGAPDDQPPLPDDVQFDVQWKADTQMLEESTIESWLESESAPEDGLYVFSETEELSALVEDSIALIPGVGLFRLVSVDRADGKVSLETTPATLLEAADKGDISWDVFVSGNRDTFVFQPENTDDSALRYNIGSRRMSARGDSIDWSAKANGYEFGLKMSKTDGVRPAISFEAVGGVTSKVGNQQVKMRSTVKGQIKMRARGHYSFDDGEVLSYDFYATDVDLEAEGSMEADGQSVKGELVNYPARIVVPFAVGPLPFYFAFGTAVKLTADVRAGQSIKFTGTVKYKGDIGITGEGLSVTEVTRTGTPEYGGNLEEDVSASAGVVASLATPRLELGVGVPSLANLGASGGLFVDLRANMAVRIQTGGPNPCLFGGIGFGAYYGGKVQIFGLTFGAEEQIYQGFQKLRERGSCE